MFAIKAESVLEWDIKENERYASNLGSSMDLTHNPALPLLTQWTCESFPIGISFQKAIFAFLISEMISWFSWETSFSKLTF